MKGEEEGRKEVGSEVGSRGRGALCAEKRRGGGRPDE